MVLCSGFTGRYEDAGIEQRPQDPQLRTSTQNHRTKNPELKGHSYRATARMV
jgi:hypothetical protein